MRIYVIGSLNMDLVIQTNKYPKLGETVEGFGFMTNPGGKGANQAVACARNGADTYMVGAVGTHFGLELRQALQRYGVHQDYVKDIEDISSGIALITLAEHDNAIVLDAGANAHVSNPDIDVALEQAKPNDFVLFQNEIPHDTVSYALKQAKSKQMITVVNPAPARTFNPEDFKYMDYLVLNQSETEFYTGIYPTTTKEAIKATKVLKQLGVNDVIITMGSLGSVCIDKEPLWVDAYTVNVVDTTAAGDTYIGALVARLSQQDSLPNAMQYASAAAALTITKKGAQQSIPSKEEVIQFMSHNPR